MKILIGTTNPSKVKRFEKMLAGYDAEFLTLFTPEAAWA